MATILDLLDKITSETGHSFGTNDFETRLRTQKTVYLLKALGHPAAQTFHYGFHLRGPYAPELAQVAFGRRPAPEAETAESWEAQHPEMMRLVLDAVDRGNDFLEAAATIHRLELTRKANDDELLEHMKRIKPRLPEGATRDALEWLRQAKLT